MISVSNTKHWLIEQSTNQPNKQAVILSERTITYQDLYNESSAAADFLQSKGIQKNDHVGILATHNYNFYLVVNALWFIGAVPVPLNTRLLTEEIEIQTRQADINFLLIDEILSEQFSQLIFSNRIYFSKNSYLERENKENKILNSQFSILNSSLIMFTSGSSGKSKAVVHTFESLFGSVKAIDSFADLSTEDIWLSSLPFFHIGGFMILVRSLIVGSSIAFPDSLEHRNVVYTIQKFLPTHISIVPTTLLRFLNENLHPNANLKYAFLGGGPSEKELILNAVNQGWPIVKVYGSTETCSMITALLPNEIKEKSESAGKALDENKIMIKRMNDSDNLAGIGEVGDIIVSAKSLFKEYYNDHASTSKSIQNGWFNSGDFGLIDKDGYLFVESRREDLIITGGENVSAKEVETVIKSLKSIKDAFVFALQDKTWGQIVCAAIVSGGLDENEIKNFLKEKIAGYKIPKRFFFLDEIPRNELGKITRAALLKLLNLN
ncbi:MAG: o-succinylbenzoate--CoA ligase [Melioribacteraceae bacterium]